jgi:hypothetical protein
VNAEPIDPAATTTQLKYIYDSYRTALLNRRYYSAKLARFQKYNSFMEIAIALGATGSGGVAGLAIWGSITGQYAWLLITAVATILGIVKPVLQLGKEIEKYTNLFSGHSSVYFDLKYLVEDIEVSRSIPPKTAEQYETIRKRIAELGGLHDPKPDEKLIQNLQAHINREIPPEKLWVPTPAPLQPPSQIQNP